MPDAEIEAVRRVLEANPRPAGLGERRKRLDALGGQYPLSTDVRVEAVDANGVMAEWTDTPEADPGNVIMYLHGGGYTAGSLKSHRHMVARAGGRPEPGRSRSVIVSRRSILFRRRSRMQSPAIASCYRAVFRRTISRSPETAPAAV